MFAEHRAIGEGRLAVCLSRRWTEAMRTHRAAAACGGLNQSIRKGKAGGKSLSRLLNGLPGDADDAIRVIDGQDRWTGSAGISRLAMGTFQPGRLG